VDEIYREAVVPLLPEVDLMSGTRLSHGRPGLMGLWDTVVPLLAEVDPVSGRIAASTRYRRPTDRAM